MKHLIIVAASLGGILLYLLASASANTALFARHYPWLLGLNAIVALALFALIVWQVRALWRGRALAWVLTRREVAARQVVCRPCLFR